MQRVFVARIAAVSRPGDRDGAREEQAEKATMNLASGVPRIGGLSEDIGFVPQLVAVYYVLNAGARSSAG